MRSSSASCSTRSLKSSHESSRLAYSSVESRSGASVSVAGSAATSVIERLLLHDQTNRQRLALPLAHELPVEDVAPGEQVDDQRLEAAVEQTVGRVARGL